MKKQLITLVSLLLISITAFSQVEITPSIKLPQVVDKDTMPTDLGTIVLNLDSIFYAYNGTEWLPLSLNLTFNTLCCPVVKYHAFLGEPTQELFEEVFGHASYDYIGTLYSPTQDKAWNFTYISGLTEYNWKWIALKD